MRTVASAVLKDAPQLVELVSAISLKLLGDDDTSGSRGEHQSALVDLDAPIVCVPCASRGSINRDRGQLYETAR